MNAIYQVRIHGKTLESRNLRQLLARAVSEKRSMDQTMRARSRAHQHIPPADSAASMPEGFVLQY